MAKEIERKFLIKTLPDDQPKRPRLIRQFYLQFRDPCVRVRIIDEPEIQSQIAFLCIKYNVSDGVRDEYEYEIPVQDARELANHKVGMDILKARYEIELNDRIWEVDIYMGENYGLKIAEIELSSKNDKVCIPNWVGEEVTDNHRYLNASLAQVPFNMWKDSSK